MSAFKNMGVKFNKISQRERLFVFLTVLVGTLAGSYFLILEPANIEMAKAEKKLQKIYTQHSDLNVQIGQIKTELLEDPLQKINDEIMVLSQKLDSLDEELNVRLVNFINASQMPAALTGVLTKSSGIEVESLTSLPVHAFSNTPGTSKSEDIITFYKHTLEIKISGDYNSVYKYLRNLEKLDDTFYWDSIAYTVTEYPLADVTLRIFTLSDQQDLVSG